MDDTALWEEPGEDEKNRICKSSGFKPNLAAASLSWQCAEQHKLHPSGEHRITAVVRQE